MAKRVRKISDDMNKDFSRRETSRKMQNERRRLQRRLAKELTEESGEKVSWKEAEQYYRENSTKNSQIESLYSSIQETYSFRDKGKQGYTVDVKKLNESVDTYSRMKYGSKYLSRSESEDELKQYRKNDMVRHQINQSTKEGGLSIYEETKTHAFYAATASLWRKAETIEERNVLIQNKFGVDDLETVYLLVTSEELDFEDFGFETKEEFDEWLEEVEANIDLEELRRIVKEELAGDLDEEDVKYPKVRISNIANRADTLLNS